MNNRQNDAEYFTQSTGIKTAYRYTPSTNASPTIIFLPGYMSDMDGSKACAIFDDAHVHGYGVMLLDYSGCGKSDGKFSDGALSIWRDEVLALIDAKIDGPVVLIGSSMGGWLMLMVALQLIESHGPQKVVGMMGIAAAPDFTDWDFDTKAKAIIAADGVLYEDNPYGPEPTPIYRKFFDDAQKQLLLQGEISIDCPVILFHGQNDNDVPFDVSMRLAKALRSSQVQLHLVKDGDHRFSREQDIAMLIAALRDFVGVDII